MNLENFSLEDDDSNGLFITQESREIIPLIPNMGNEESNEGEVCDMGDVHAVTSTPYSDISDAEDFQIPPSQTVQAKGNER